MYRNFAEAAAAFEADRAQWEGRGATYAGAQAYAYDAARIDYRAAAMDAQPGLQTDPNSGIPWGLVNIVDPTTYEILFAPTNAAKIAGEERRGDWTSPTMMFPTVEHTGEVTSYSDDATGGVSGANADWPVWQSYLYQTVKKLGDRQIAMAAAARVDWVGQVDRSAANNLNRFANWSYFYGVAGLQNYGIFNDPNLPASITPSAKAYGGTTWYSGGVVKATPNEMFNDFQALYAQLVSQSNSLVDTDTPLVLGISPASNAALIIPNVYGLTALKMITEQFKKLRIEQAPQYGVASSANSQGNPAGNFMQLIAEEVEGQRTMFCAYNERARAFPIVRELSSWKQKIMGGTWGTVIRQPAFVASMIGV